MLKPTKLQNLQKFFTKRPMRFKTDNGVQDLPLVAWDSISICDGKTCPVNMARCPYFRRIAAQMARTNTEQRCLVQAKYLRLVYKNIISAHTRKNLSQMDEAMMTNIGFMLLPLYGQLIKFKLIEAGIPFDQMIRPNGQVHPVYQTIRQTIKDIKEISKEVLPQNLQRIAMQAIDVNSTLDNANGLTDYHDKLERSAARQYQLGTMEQQT